MRAMQLQEFMLKSATVRKRKNSSPIRTLSSHNGLTASCSIGCAAVAECSCCQTVRKGVFLSAISGSCGGPYVSSKYVSAGVPHSLLVELQHFDLAGPVVPDIKYLDQIDPLFVLWNNHDLDRVKTEGLVFQTNVDKGRLLVSSLRHTGDDNAAGRWLFGLLLRRIAGTPVPKHSLSHSTAARMRAKIDEQKIDLTTRSWRFRPDPDNNGLAAGWQRPNASDQDWKPIRIGIAWEGAGYPQLDGWAWYRISVDIPDSWQDRPIYFCIEGADDYYEVYANGKKAGAGGNIAKRQTAFDLRASHNIRPFVVPGQTASLAVRVYDWYGAGGLFRPIYLSTSPIGTGVDVLK